MRDHGWIEELIVVRSLGGLDPDDEHELHREMLEHGAECSECRRLEAEYPGYEEAAGRLAFALDPVPVREGLEDQVVASALGGQPMTLATPRRLRRERRQPSQVLRPLVAVAASLVLFAIGWAAGALTSGDDVSVLPGARVVQFEGEGGATLALAYRPGDRGVYLVGSLDPRPGDETYELWTFRGDTPVRGGCFRPGADGSVFEFLDAEIEPTPLMAVTVESASCPSAPTTDPILIAQVAV
ncbi:MAG: anti-sigma factor domain-containing protein [Actinomycetota bacterium]